MKILKRNQLIILAISLMLITAGYLNFTSNYNNTITTTMKTAELGDATLVSSNNVVTKEQPVTNGMVENNIMPDDSQIIETVNANNEQYFVNSKLERNMMYSQMLETYQKIYNDSSATAEQKTEAIEKISDINNTKNAIMIAENLIMAKNFKNVIIFSNTASISVIVETEEITQEQIAQIQNIVSRELNVVAENIHISTK